MMIRRVPRRALVLGLLTSLVLAGCAHVVTQTTPFYEEGPYQLEDPQGELAEGTWVWVVGHEGTYSRIWTLDGIDAYVWDNATTSLWEWFTKRTAERKAAEQPEPIVMEPTW